jgi:hypothetical protein
MQKLILVSIVLMLVVLPTLASRERDPRLALKKAVWWTVTGIAFYVLLLLFVYPRFVG